MSIVTDFFGGSYDGERPQSRNRGEGDEGNLMEEFERFHEIIRNGEMKGSWQWDLRVEREEGVEW